MIYIAHLTAPPHAIPICTRACSTGVIKHYYRPGLCGLPRSFFRITFEGAGLPRMIVLIADDFEEHRLLMRQVAEKRGHRVVEASNGQEAIEAAERELPDLMLLDLA